MPSEVEICNRALSWLGAKRISSLTETTRNAEICNIHFALDRDDLLSGFPWVFARQRVSLAQLTNDRTGEWEYKYQMPDNMARLEWINNAELALLLEQAGQNKNAAYALVGDVVYTNVESVTCEYTEKVTDSSLFPAHFAKALSWRLASSIVVPITQDDRRSDAIMRKAMSEVEDSEAIDSNLEQTPHNVAPEYTAYRPGNTGLYDENTERRWWR